MGKLTSRTLANSSAITPTTLIHVVWTGDTTDSPEGSSFKAELQQLNSIFSGSSTPFTGGTVTGSTIFTNGLTATTISATTYQNLPTDIRVTGATYLNNTFTFTNNTGGTFNTTFNIVTGLTVNGDLTITGTTTIGSISATTYQNLPVSGLTTGSNISLVNNNGNYTISVTGDTHWTSGSTGNYSIKTNNDSGLDSIGDYSVAEGYSTNAIGNYSHAEGEYTTASGLASHAENSETIASGNTSHAEGYNTIAGGNSAHAGGSNSSALGDFSFIHSLLSTVTGTRSAILGGQGITGSANDTVYVPYFNIQSATTDNNLTEILAIDTNGDVKKRNVNTIGSSFTGGTVTGATNFTNGLTANTISATTYQNLPVNGLTAGNNINISGSSGNFTISVTGITGGVSIDPYNNGGSGTTISWNVSGVSTNYFATLTATTTLNLTNVRNGDYGTIILTQDSIGGRTLTLGTVNGGTTTHKVANGGGGSVVLTSNANAIDILTFTYNGSTMFWTVGNDYT
jgi:hypothetical protein